MNQPDHYRISQEQRDKTVSVVTAMLDSEDVNERLRGAELMIQMEGQNIERSASCWLGKPSAN